MPAALSPTPDDMKISINGSAIAGAIDVARIIAHVAAAEQDGFGGYWLQQSGLIDALTVYAAAAATTGRIELGTAVIPVVGQHPAALAAQALTAHAVTGGRIALGIGSSHRTTVEQRWGQRWDRPVDRLIGHLDILQPLLETGSVDQRGQAPRSTMDAVRPSGEPPAVLLAALGPRMLRICGQRTSGTITWLAGPTTITTHIAPRLREAAAEAGRPPPRIVCSLPVVVTNDTTRATRRTNAALAAQTVHDSYRRLLELEGATSPADVALIGDEASVTRQLEALVDAGATEIAAVELGATPAELARTRELLARLNTASTTTRER